MPAAPAPPDESGRLKALLGLGILDSPPDAEFDALVRAASLVCGVPVSLISLVDEDRQWFKAKVGLPGANQTPRDMAFCAYAILSDELLEITDATQDPRVADNPLVTGHPHIRFYAGVPLRVADAAPVGTLCVIDQQPRVLTDTQREILRNLATAATTALQGWRIRQQQKQDALALAESEANQRRLNQALRIEQQRLSNLIEISGMATCEWNLQTGAVRFSDRWAEILGRTLADLAPLSIRTWHDYIHPIDAPAVARHLAEHLAGKTDHYECEFRVRHRDGHYLWVLSRGAIVSRTADGQPEWLFGARRDISDTKRQEAALQQANDRVRLATDSGGIGIWDWDVVTNTTTWDARNHQLYGLQPGEGDGLHESWRRRLHPADVAAVDHAVRDALADTKPYDTEFRVIWEDGSVHHLRGAGRVTRDPAGQPVRMVGVNWDVTEARRLAAELTRQIERQAEAFERESALFRNSPDVLTVIRVDEEAGEPVFRYDAISPAVERLLGFRPEDLVGRRLEDCLPPEAAASALAQCRACLQQDATIVFAATLATSKGKRDIEGSRTPIRHPAGGRITRIVGAMRDVTERKRLEAAEHHGQKLEAIGRLASGVAHDFNNLLQSISASLELVQDELKPDTTAHHFAEIGLRAARHGAHLTHHLLSYARKQMLRPQLITLPLLLADVEALLTRTLDRAVVVTVRADPAATPVCVDSGQLQTALLNLAINAAQAMPRGGALLIESRAFVEDGQNWVGITVSDTGTGMDEATLARAIEPFFTTRGVDGSGLGLSMVQGFAEQSGGRLRLSSVPGEGTTVILQLLRAVALPSPPTVEQQSPKPPTGAWVMVVDDDADVLVTTAAFLEKSGFKVLRASSADHALALLAGGVEVDTIVTDYAMPGMNGLDFLTESRTNRPQLPGVIISGFADLAASEEIGAATIMLRKPFQRDDLLAAVRKLMGAQPATAE